MIRRPPRSTLFPTRRSSDLGNDRATGGAKSAGPGDSHPNGATRTDLEPGLGQARDLFRSEEHTSELQSQSNLVCRLLLEKKKKKKMKISTEYQHICSTAFIT